MADVSTPPTDRPVGFFHTDQVSPLTTVLLRHLGDQGFELAQSFVFRGASGEWRVDERELPVTDLTSTPWFYRWYIPRYGPHLLPALLHDWMLGEGAVDRDEADNVFGEALKLQGVAPIRRLLMGAAVTLATRWTSWSRRIPIIIWFALALVGVATVANGVFSWYQPGWWSDWFVALAVLAPIPASVLWDTKWLNGVVAGYSLIILAPVTIAIWITRAITGLFEASVE